MRKIKDSGKRQKFKTGAVRDVNDNKPRPDLISPFFSERLGNWLALGAKKYSARNWEKGISNERNLESFERHLMQYKQGLEDEDHLGAMACNLMFIIHNEEMIKRKLLPEELDDVPKYLQQKEI